MDDWVGIARDSFRRSGHGRRPRRAGQPLELQRHGLYWITEVPSIHTQPELQEQTIDGAGRGVLRPPRLGVAHPIRDTARKMRDQPQGPRSRNRLLVRTSPGSKRRNPLSRPERNSLNRQSNAIAGRVS